jgi:hypothetical protein
MPAPYRGTPVLATFICHLLFLVHTGVTIDPVTVPFVLAIGIGFSKAVGANEGFGMVSLQATACTPVSSLADCLVHTGCQCTLLC